MKIDPLVELLQSRLRQKQQRNKAYSLRSLSRDLGIDPSNLSKILSRRKNIGSKLRRNLAQKLGFETGDIETWLSTAIYDKTSDVDYTYHDLETFKIISQWQHYVILELYKLKNFGGTSEEVSRFLGLSVSECKESIHRLQSIGLLVLDKRSGKLRPKDDSSSSILNINTSTAHREQQKQILEGAIDAVDQVPIGLRSQSSMTVAIDTKKLEVARELIKKFRRDLGRLLSTSNDIDDVYQISISLYPATKIFKGGRK